MPTYDYRCRACGHEFEEFQSMTAPVLKKCPECGKNQLERLIGTGAALIFKGSGFYQTDYRTESYKKGAESEKSGGDKSESRSESKADSKPDGKAEAAPAAKASDSKPVDKAPATKAEPKAAPAKASGKSGAGKKK